MAPKRTAALGAALLTLALAAPAAEARVVGGCRVPQSAKVDVVSRLVVVYSVTDGDFRDVFACRRSNGWTRRILQTFEDDCCASDVLSHIQVNGRFVALVRDERYRGEQFLRVLVWNAFRGKLAHTRMAAFDPRYGDAPTSVVPALVLSRTGAAAYVVRHEAEADYNGTPRVRVGLRTVEADGSRLLDKGDGVDPASLRLDGATVHWSNAGKARSAAIR